MKKSEAAHRLWELADRFEDITSVVVSVCSATGLSCANFWGLFLITGATSLLCAAVHLVAFLVANRRRIRDELASTSSDVPW
ncbi:hypothetical protein ACP4OV_023967 [Aristida adscensionis]